MRVDIEDLKDRDVRRLLATAAFVQCIDYDNQTMNFIWDKETNPTVKYLQIDIHFDSRVISYEDMLSIVGGAITEFNQEEDDIKRAGKQ